MNKKIIIGSVIAAVIIAVIVGVCLFDKPQQEDNTEMVEPVETSTPGPVTLPDDTPIEEQDRTLIFDNYVGVQKKEDDYANTVEEARLIDPAHSLYGVYDFSNGFAAVESSNLERDYATDGGVYFKSKFDDTTVFIREIDPTTTTVQEMREVFLKEHGMNGLYFNSLTADIPFGTTYTVEHGIVAVDDYFAEYTEESAYYNKTYNIHVLVDCIEKTAYGNAITEVIMYGEGDRYTLYSSILCDRDRILEVWIESSEYEHLKDYLIETTNDVIVMIK